MALRRRSLTARALPVCHRRRGLRFESLEGRALLAAVTSGAPTAPVYVPALSTLELLDREALQRSFNSAAELSRYSAEQINATETWVVSLPATGDIQALAQQVGHVAYETAPLIPHTYLLNFPLENGRNEAAKLLDQASGVLHFYPLVTEHFEKRLIPNDPLFARQWHLRNTGQTGGTAGADANLTNVWNTQLGTGVVIGVVDDGLQYTHPDLAPNYRGDLSYDFWDNDTNPLPEFNFFDGSTDSHGTAAAGVAAARGNNSLGVSGAAPNASLAGLRLVVGDFSDSQTGRALSHRKQDIDIYSNSWGPADIGVLDSKGPFGLSAVQQGASTGRDGLGNIYTWAAGNGLERNDNVNYDGFANSRLVIAVTAIDHNGKQSYYAEPGAPILVSAYSSGDTNLNLPEITTTDISGADGYNYVASAADGDSLADLNYTSTFGGTSSATPLVSGVVALMLQANPALTYRDVQHILVQTAKKNDPNDAGWANNGAGLHVNHKYGFGAIDAQAAVTAALTWTNVAPQVAAKSPLLVANAAIPDNNGQSVQGQIQVNQDITLEWAEIVFDATHTYSGDLEVILVSPAGTVSVLAETHVAAFGENPGDYSNWTFTTNHSWGESSNGTWTLQVTDKAARDTGTLNHVQINFYGTPGPNFRQTAQVQGTVFSDVNGDGVYDASEPGINGAQVYIDINNNGQYDANEPSTLAGPDGTYILYDLTAGSGVVGAVPIPTYQQTLPAGNAGQPVTLVANQTLTGINFGFRPTVGTDPFLLHNTPGDGTLEVGVDGFGAFGSSAGGNTTDAFYDPVGPVGAGAGTVFESAVALKRGNAVTMLGSGSIGGGGGLSNPIVSGTPTSGNSTFTVGNLSFVLQQTLSDIPGEAGVRGGSLLTQRYVVTNTGATAESFQLTRYFDGDLKFDNNLIDGGGRLANGTPEILFETDSATGSLDATTFIGITSEGGAIPAVNRYEADSYSGLLSRINAGTPLDDTITGDGPDADQFVDIGNGYDITLGLANLFDLAPGATAEYVTTTIFGTGTPQSFQVPKPATASGVKFNDLNANGARDENEPGLPDWIIYLDLNKDGRIGLGEPAARTDANGKYTFANLVPGTYNLREAYQPGWRQTTPGGTGTISITVDLEQNLTGVDFGNTAAYDYGDAPGPFPTLRAQGGAVHGYQPEFFLGTSLNDEDNGHPTVNAANDADDDGVVFTSGLVAGTTATVDVTASRGGFLHAWVDFNNDGFWAPSEQIFTDTPVAPGVNHLTYQVSTALTTGAWIARFRYSVERGVGVTGLARAGEVEDYSIAAALTAPAAARFSAFTNRNNRYDVSGDGKVSNLDAFMLIAELRTGSGVVEYGTRSRQASEKYCDVTGDGMFTNLDVYSVISQLRAKSGASGEGESEIELPPLEVPRKKQVAYIALLPETNSAPSTASPVVASQVDAFFAVVPGLEWPLPASVIPRKPLLEYGDLEVALSDVEESLAADVSQTWAGHKSNEEAP